MISSDEGIGCIVSFVIDSIRPKCTNFFAKFVKKITMWRSIQTWLILAAAILLASMFAMDMCSTVVPETGEHFGIKFSEHPKFLTFTFVTFMLAVITMFHHEKRLMQMRLCLLNSLMLIGYQAWIIVECVKIIKGYGLYSISIGSFFPAICIILLMTAVPFIIKAESSYAFGEMIEKNKKKSKK